MRGGAVVQEPRREDREHAGVRIRERLPRPVRVEQPQRDRRHTVRRPGDEARALLVVLRQRIDRGQPRPLPFRRRHRLEPGEVPVARRELLARALGGLDLLPVARRRRALRRRCSCSTRRRAFGPAVRRCASSSDGGRRASSPTCTPRARTSTARHRRAPRDGRPSRHRRARARDRVGVAHVADASSTSSFR